MVGMAIRKCRVRFTFCMSTHPFYAASRVMKVLAPPEYRSEDYQQRKQFQPSKQHAKGAYPRLEIRQYRKGRGGADLIQTRSGIADARDNRAECGDRIEAARQQHQRHTDNARDVNEQKCEHGKNYFIFNNIAT